MVSAAEATDLIASVVTSDTSKELIPTAPDAEPTLTVTLEPVTESSVMSANVLSSRVSVKPEAAA